MKKILISKSVINEIYDSIVNESFEVGGILGEDSRGIITHFCFDCFTEKIGKNVYRPSVKWLNNIIEQWEKQGICFCGIIHNHPEGYSELSIADKLYAEQILRLNETLKEVYFPIIVSSKEPKLEFWIIKKNVDNEISNCGYSQVLRGIYSIIKEN